MKFIRSLTRKRLLTAALAATILLGSAAGFSLYNHPTRKFERAASSLFQEEMSASTLNMHYTLANPADYGIDYEPVLPAYTQTSQEESRQQLQEKIAFFQELDANALSQQDAHTLTLLLSYLEAADALNDFPYYEEPLSPSSGMQSQLPILLAEYTFRSARDVEDYLGILAQTGDYFDSLLTYEQEKKEAGLLMSASSMRQVADQCRTILTADALENNAHFLQITFRERLQELYDAGLLEKQTALGYIQENNRILTEIMMPAYERLAEGLTALADPNILPQGLAAKPDGAAYYEALLTYETGSHRSIAEITEMLTGQLTAEFDNLRAYINGIDGDLLTEESSLACSKAFPLQTSAEMLTDLKNRMEGTFPAFPDAADTTPNIHVKEVAACLQDYCAPAFYLTPPLDDSADNSIYINTKTTIDPIDLYTTLAHEGFPGHMYQTVYSNQKLLAQGTVPVQQLTWFGGYLEGWALYVEFMAYDYAAEIMEEIGEPEYATLIKIEKHNRSLQLCLYSLLDILIHHENTNYQGTAEVLANFGITNSASVSRIYEYIVDEPANYPKYYLGYLEILSLKEACRNAWGTSYSDYTFHQFFLDNGPADFETLQNLVTRTP